MKIDLDDLECAIKAKERQSESERWRKKESAKS